MLLEEGEGLTGEQQRSLQGVTFEGVSVVCGEFLPCSWILLVPPASWGDADAVPRMDRLPEDGGEVRSSQKPELSSGYLVARWDDCDRRCKSLAGKQSGWGEWQKQGKYIVLDGRKTLLQLQMEKYAAASRKKIQTGETVEKGGVFADGQSWDAYHTLHPGTRALPPKEGELFNPLQLWSLAVMSQFSKGNTPLPGLDVMMDCAHLALIDIQRIRGAQPPPVGRRGQVLVGQTKPFGNVGYDLSRTLENDIITVVMNCPYVQDVLGSDPAVHARARAVVAGRMTDPLGGEREDRGAHGLWSTVVRNLNPGERATYERSIRASFPLPREGYELARAKELERQIEKFIAITAPHSVYQFLFRVVVKVHPQLIDVDFLAAVTATTGPRTEPMLVLALVAQLRLFMQRRHLYLQHGQNLTSAISPVMVHNFLKSALAYLKSIAFDALVAKKARHVEKGGSVVDAVGDSCLADLQLYLQGRPMDEFVLSSEEERELKSDVFSVLTGATMIKFDVSKRIVGEGKLMASRGNVSGPQVMEVMSNVIKRAVTLNGRGQGTLELAEGQGRVSRVLVGLGDFVANLGTQRGPGKVRRVARRTGEALAPQVVRPLDDLEQAAVSGFFVAESAGVLAGQRAMAVDAVAYNNLTKEGRMQVRLRHQNTLLDLGMNRCQERRKLKNEVRMQANFQTGPPRGDAAPVRHHMSNAAPAVQPPVLDVRYNLAHLLLAASAPQEPVQTAEAPPLPAAGAASVCQSSSTSAGQAPVPSVIGPLASGDGGSSAREVVGMRERRGLKRGREVVNKGGRSSGESCSKILARKGDEEVIEAEGSFAPAEPASLLGASLPYRRPARKSARSNLGKASRKRD